jgi:two-component system chemotaxis sensor kinase CheA
MKLSDDQISELREIFKEEALNHVKAIGKVFIRLADGEVDDAIEPIGQAYREAHGLKGSAGTIGITRIALLGEQLEQTLKLMTQERLPLEFEDIEMLLDALDVIRQALDDISQNADQLTEGEIKIIASLEAFIDAHSSKGEPPLFVRSSAPPARTSFVDDLVHAPSPDPSTVTEDVEDRKQPRRELDIPSEQMSYLMSVFRTEAAEHVKSLAEMLFNLEEGRGDVTQMLVKAFREAHSLKGSSGTIGFERVATVTHALEDVFGALQKSPKETTPEVVDVLLDTIDVIRRSVKEGVIGDASLSTKEANIVKALKRLVEDITSRQVQPASAVESSLPPEPTSRSATPSIKPASASSDAPQERPSIAEFPSREASFIRVSEESISNLIAQVGELFEAHLYLMSATRELDRLETNVNGLYKAAADWREGVSVAVDQDAAADALVEQIRGLKTQLAEITKNFARDERQFSKLIQNSQEALRKIRLALVSTIFVMIRRQVREICRLTGKRVELFLDGGEYTVDRKVLEAIEDPLIHILRNAVDHGIEDAEGRKRAGKNEKGRISVVARHIGDAVELVIADDGAGIDPEKVRKSLKKKKLMRDSEIDSMTRDELFDCLFESGVTTQSDVSKISGRGVGLDVVKHTMERLGGEVRLDSHVGKGTVFSLRLPLSMSTLRCLLTRVSGRIMAIPASNVEKVLIQGEEDVKEIGGGYVITYKGQNVPLGSLSDLLHLARPSPISRQNTRIVTIISFGERRFAFTIDDIVEYAQVILRPLGDLLERVPYVSGISLLGTGELALVLNPSDLVRASGSAYIKRTREQDSDKSFQKYAACILVVDDSMATRTLEKSLLESAGYNVVTASDGYKALEVLNDKKIDLIITDIQMPNMNGLDLTRTVKTQYRFLQLPVILVSALGSDEDKARGLEIGADAYIVKKELSQKELVDTIEQLL